MRNGCAGVPVVAVALPLPVFVKSGRVDHAMSTASDAPASPWNGPGFALMSYGASPFVGSTTRIVTVGVWPGAAVDDLQHLVLELRARCGDRVDVHDLRAQVAID